MLLAIFLALLAPGHAEPCADDASIVSDIQGIAHATPRSPQTAPAPISADAFEAEGLRAKVFSLALKAHQNAVKRGDTTKDLLTVIDYSLPSYERRLWVVDLKTGRLLFHEYVAHGKKSGTTYAKSFSNKNGSNQSNIGLMVTQGTYDGKYKHTLRLKGLEPGWNDNALDRLIVMHGATYATEAFVKQHGRLGRSLGCPALDPAVATRVIDTIKGGSVVFGYYPDDRWLERSQYLK